MAFNIKKASSPKVMAGLAIAAAVWFLLGWFLGMSKFAIAFQTIDHYGFMTWLASPLAIKTPLVLFWYVILALIGIGWIISLVFKAKEYWGIAPEKPLLWGSLCAACIVAALLVLFHTADMLTTTRIANIKIANEGTVTFKNGAEISLNEMQHTNGAPYLNLNVTSTPQTIYRDTYRAEDNTVMLGFSKSGRGASFQRTYLTKPFYDNGTGIVIQHFYGNQDNTAAAGVTVTYSQKPLLPFIAVLYIFLALTMLGALLGAAVYKDDGETEPLPAKLPSKITATAGKLPAKKRRVK